MIVRPSMAAFSTGIQYQLLLADAQGIVVQAKLSSLPTEYTLSQNYPNPFNPETTIPFTIGDAPVCDDPGRTYRVTLRIYNVLAQLVAIPLLIGGGEKLENVPLTCGSYTAFWNGKYLDSDREVASGIYLYRLEVDGKAVVKKMIVMK